MKPVKSYGIDDMLADVPSFLFIFFHFSQSCGMLKNHQLTFSQFRSSYPTFHFNADPNPFICVHGILQSLLTFTNRLETKILSSDVEPKYFRFQIWLCLYIGSRSRFDPACVKIGILDANFSRPRSFKSLLTLAG